MAGRGTGPVGGPPELVAVPDVTGFGWDAASDVVLRKRARGGALRLADRRHGRTRPRAMVDEQTGEAVG